MAASNKLAAAYVRIPEVLREFSIVEWNHGS